MAVFLQSQADGDDPEQVLAAHDDLRDLLEPLLRPEPPTANGPTRLGDFELVREVGRGGMGVVYESRQRSLGRRVALKVLTADLSSDPTRLARFRREAVTLARLEHRHVVRVLDTGETEGRHWLAMEFVDGESLDQRLQRLSQSGGHRDGSRRQAVETVLAVAEALQHVHAAGILHRDVKPSNILLANDGRVLLSDFGLARDERAPTLTQQGLLAGTPHYLAPECLTSGATTAASDVWSLGATLYEAITLVRPFDGPTPDVVLQRVVHHEPKDPRRLQPGLHRDLAAIVGKALEKDPRRRYPTMAAFAADLQAFLDLRPTLARPPTATQRLQRWIRREPLRALLAAAVVALVGLVTFVVARLPAIQAGERAARAAAYEEAVAEGFVRRGEGQQAAATAAAAKARRLRPTSGEAMVVEALVALRFQDPATALQQLDRLQALPHDDDDDLQRLRALVLGRLRSTAERDELLGRLGPPRTQMGLLLAAGLLVEQRTAEGVAQARSLISLATRIAPPRLLVHLQWATLAAPAERAECADALLRLWPEQPFALHHAASLLQWSDPVRALHLQQQAVEGGLQDQWASYNLAMYAWQAGDKAVAVAAALRAMADPGAGDDRRAALVQVLLDHAPGEVEQAIRVWQQHFPASVHARRELAKFRGANDPLLAIEGLQALLRDHPTDRESQKHLALACERARRWNDMAAAARSMLAADPGDREAHDLLMNALDELPESGAERLAELRRYVALVQDDPRAWRDLADVLLAGPPAGHGEALRAAMRAVDLAGAGDEKAALVLARAHEALGERAAATAVRERAGSVAPAQVGR
jgi:predicted Ser/Thr protein kinase/tetratricopeptide (TPR) repeat protein